MLPINITLTALTVLSLLIIAIWLGIKRPFGTSLTTLAMIAVAFGLALLAAIFFELQLIETVLVACLK